MSMELLKRGNEEESKGPAICKRKIGGVKALDEKYKWNLWKYPYKVGILFFKAGKQEKNWWCEYWIQNIDEDKYPYTMGILFFESWIHGSDLKSCSFNLLAHN